MRKVALIALLAGGSVALPAAAQPLSLTLPELRQRIPNGEFRGYTLTNRGFENQIWHFRPDGYIRAVADARIRRGGVPMDEYQQWQDVGIWSIVGGQVCVSFQGPNRNLDGCYAISAGSGKQVRVIGPYIWEGTLERHD